MKLGQVAASAAETIAMEMAKINLGENTNDYDPFASDVEEDMKKMSKQSQL